MGSAMYYINESQIVGGTPAITFTVTGTLANSPGILCFTLSGVDQTTPVDSFDTYAANSVTSYPISCATTNANGWVVAGGGNASNSTAVTTWSPLSEHLDTGDGTTRYFLASGAGTGSAVSPTPTSTTASVAIVIAAFAPSGGPSVPTITDAGDESFLNAETGITITGTNFGTGGGSSAIIISPTDNVADGSAVTQTETGTRTSTSATFTAVRGALSHSTNLYLFVKDSTGTANATGYVVQFAPDKKLRLAVHSSAQSATGIQGVVFAAPTGGNITGTEIGEFTGQTFEGSLEGGLAILKVNVLEFGGSSLTTSDTPVVLIKNTTNTTGIIPATIIEE
jgi:hypothetical protein